MSRKKRASPQFKKTLTTVSVTPKTFSSQDGGESVISSIHTQSSQEHSSSGFTPVVTTRRNTFGGRKTSRIVDSLSDDIFFSPSILCRKNLIKEEAKDKTSKVDVRLSFSCSADTSTPPNGHATETESHLCRKRAFSVKNRGQKILDPKSTDDPVNISSVSEGSSLGGNSDSEPQTMEGSQSNEFKFDEMTIHSTTAPIGTKQPSSTMTSLAEARAYFARLDASPLIMEAADAGGDRRKVVRTRRRLLPTHPMVMKEYKKYQIACKSAQVSPISLEDFARHRGKFQTPDVLYEGFLDEED